MQKLSFSRWRRRLWPVHNYELKKLLPILLIKFFIIFIYTLLREAKDTLIVTAENSGAEAIPALKGWVVLPSAFLVMLLYSRLSTKYNRSTMFYGVIGSFMSFFILYGFVLYPNRDLLCPHESADYLVSLLGPKRQHLIAIYRYWMNSLFFIAAELWGGMCIGLLFWGFVNHVSKISEAKRFYTIFSAGGDFAVIIAAPVLWFSSKSFSHDDFEITLKFLISCVLIAGILIVAIYWWINQHLLTDTRFFSPEEQLEKKHSKPQLSLKESLLFIARSRYLACIAFMVIAYGLAFGMLEVTWKATLKMHYPNPNDYLSFMSIVSLITGLSSLLVTLFIGGNLIRHFGWYVSSQLTPIILTITASLFLFSYFSKDYLPNKPIFWGITPLLLVILLGALQNVTNKTMKYSLFDPTKEMAFIPLDENSKVVGKAAIDVVGARLGKSGASWIQLFFIELAGTGSILGVTHYLVPFIFGTIVLWIYSVFCLNKRFTEIKDQHKPNKLEPLNTNTVIEDSTPDCDLKTLKNI